MAENSRVTGVITPFTSGWGPPWETVVLGPYGFNGDYQKAL